MIAPLLAAVWGGAARRAEAQLARATLPVTLGSGVIEGTIPFDVPFILATDRPPGLREVRLWVGSQRDGRLADWRADCPLLRPPPGAPRAGGTGRTDVDPQTGAAITADSFLAVMRVPAAQYAAERDRLFLLRAIEVNSGIARVLGRIVPGNPDPVPDRAAPEWLLDARRHAALSRARFDGARADAVAPRTGLRIAVEPTWVWNPGKLDSVTRVALEVDGIEPNRDYTFCFHLVRDPTKEAAAEFSRKAAGNVRAVLDRVVRSRLDSLPQLDALQEALVAALPAADSIEIDNPRSVFRGRGQDGESDAERLTRLDRLAAVYVAARETYREAIQGLADASSDVVTGARALDQLVTIHAPALRRIAVASDDSLVRVRGAQFAAAGALARRLSFVRTGIDNYTASVAAGARAVDDFGPQLRGRDLGAAKSAADIRRYADTLQRSIAALDGVRALAEYVRTDRRYAGRTPADARALDDLIEALAAALGSLDAGRNTLAILVGLFDASEQSVAKLVADVATLDFAQIALRGTTSTTYQARANMHIGLDAGLLVGWRLRSVVPYYGVNLYARPVNKNAPLKGCWKGCMRRRLSLTVGTTATSVRQANRVEDLVSSRALLVGLGTRVTDYVRGTAGWLVLRDYPDGPQERARTNSIPALSTSLDIDVVNLLGRVAAALFP